MNGLARVRRGATAISKSGGHACCRMNLQHLLLVGVLVLVGLSGCLSDDAPEDNLASGAEPDLAPFLGYKPVEPDMALELLEQSFLLAGEGGTQIYVRVVRPDTSEPVPVIAQFTPYTAPGENAQLDTLLEPAVPNNVGTFDTQFVRRGYAMAYADVRGTGDSDGCLDLRGPLDVLDAWHLTEFLGTQDWSNGNVGFIGASYPGSEAHIAGIANNRHLAAVVPVVASTSFYHYHHNDGVPYFANHLATNSGYTQQAVSPTTNPTSFAQKLADQPLCPNAENAIVHGAADQTGSYYQWWMDRNLRALAPEVQVPVLMAQGLADWNVKPDHIAHWFNDLDSQTGASKTLIAGQWGHQYPRNEEGAYGDWYPYVSAFFDTFLKEVDTGMFETDVAWVQDNNSTWHRSANWPLLGHERESMTLLLHPEGKVDDQLHMDSARQSWYACSDMALLGRNVDTQAQCPEAPGELVFTTAPFAKDALLSGVPLVNLTLESESEFTHLIVVIDRLDEKGEVVASRENYGYLNPTFRNGIEAPEPVPVGSPYAVTIDLYPQEDLVKAGESLRITLRSNDSGAIGSYQSGWNHLLWDGEQQNSFWLPLRPVDLQGVRLD